MKPHIYAELIKAWADGAEIELKHNGKWIDAGTQVTWYECNEYRLKPQPKPDHIVAYYVCYDFVHHRTHYIPGNRPNIKFIFSGDTSELKAVELLQ